MSQPIITVENIGKKYQIGKFDPNLTIREVLLNLPKKLFSPQSQTSDFWSLKNISFEVNEGDVVGIIGKNGAGKSTLLKILSRITSPTTGKITLNGRIASLLEVGTGFNPELTGRENIFLNGSILGMTREEIRRKFDEIVEFSGVSKFLDTPVKRYSSGMYVRLAFAVAAHLESEILIIDEVLAVGDAEFQKKCLGKMGDLAKNGRTVLFVSHNISAIQNLCKKALVLADGEKYFLGSVEKAIDKYNTLNMNLQKIPLENRKDRQGLGNCKIKNIEITNEENIETGDTFIVKTIFTNDPLNPITEFGLSIWDRNDNKIISLSSQYDDELDTMDIGECVFCKIPQLPLVEGDYTLNFFVSSRLGLEDYITHIKSFKVKRAKFYKTTKTVDPNWGKIVLNHKWLKRLD